MLKSVKYSIPFFMTSVLITTAFIISKNFVDQNSSQKITDRQAVETDFIVTVPKIVFSERKNSGFGIKTKVPKTRMEQKKLTLRFFDVTVTYDRFSTLWLNKPTILQLSMTPENFSDTKKLKQEIGGRIPSIKPESDTISVKALGSAELKISPTNPIAHRVSKLGTSVYQWKIEPMAATDSAKIVLTTSVHLDEGPPFPLEPYEMTFEIKSSVFHSITSFIQEINPLWTFLLAFVPAMWGLIVFFRKRET